MIFKTGEPRKTAHVLHTRSAPLLGFVGLLGAKRLIGRESARELLEEISPFPWIARSEVPPCA